MQIRLLGVTALLKAFMLLSLEMMFTACQKVSEDPCVEFVTTEGTFVVQLFHETPKHRDNFIKLVEDGYYDNLLIHRVERGYMMQTGDPQSKNASVNRRIGTGGPDYTIDAEIDSLLSDSAHESRLFNARGALTAARMPDYLNPSRTSNGSQFYIIVGQKFTQTQLDTLEQADRDAHLDRIWQKLIMANRSKLEECERRADGQKRLDFMQDSLTEEASNLLKCEKTLHFSDAQRKTYVNEGGVPALDGNYTVFGKVIKGLEVIMKINDVAVNRQFRPLEDVRIISAKVTDGN